MKKMTNYQFPMSNQIQNPKNLTFDIGNYSLTLYNQYDKIKTGYWEYG